MIMDLRIEFRKNYRALAIILRCLSYSVSERLGVIELRCSDLLPWTLFHYQLGPPPRNQRGTA